MTQRLVCPLGHTWTGAASSPCPECGAIGRVELAMTALDLGTRIHGVPLTQSIGGPAESGGPVPTVAGCEVLGELARGGMGVVYRAHDTALGRDLALKVLRAEHAGQADLCQRFLEEAQVGGQLQHPGIVPVYHVGVAGDGRPCFSMKLVQGRTLGELLRGRTMVTEEQTRFLTIFEQICQALAYAHDHGVLHRDLKPDNVMVGAFGEVLVMDWGLAKVLAWAQRGVRTVRTAAGSLPSESGSVLGTPAYMAPEQARGETQLLDERADVFGLGAILCEILTGTPPYVGATSGEVALLAAQADLTPALARLDACGADADLIKLARECLAVDWEARPRDAGLVADRIISHRAVLLERSTRAVVEQELAKLSPQQAPPVPSQPDGGWMTPVISLSVCLVLLACLVFMCRLETQQAKIASLQEEKARQKSAMWEDLRQAMEYHREGRFAEAWRALARAEGRLKVDDDEPQGMREVRDALMSVDIERELPRHLDADARLSSPLGPRPTAADEQYRQTFALYGLKVEAQDPISVARKVQASPAARRIVAALDDWARAAAPDRAMHLRQVANLADTDPWQRQVRAAASGHDGNELQRLATKPEAITPTGALLLAEALAGAGEANAALALLRTAQRRHLDDLSLAWTLAARLHEEGPKRHSAEVLRLLSLAVGLAPASAPLRLDLANALVDAGLTDEALEAYQAARRLRPANVEACRGLALTLVEMGRYPEAQEVVDDPVIRPRLDNETKDRMARLVQLEELLPAYRSGKQKVTDAATATELGEICQRKDHYAAAAGFYATAMRLDPTAGARLRHEAAVVAVRAGCGQGADAPRGEADRARLRRLAMTWVSDELTACGKLQSSGIWGSRAIVASRVRALLDDPELAPVRAPERVAAFSEQERGEWQEMWHLLGALLSR